MVVGSNFVTVTYRQCYGIWEIWGKKRLQNSNLAQFNGNFQHGIFPAFYPFIVFCECDVKHRLFGTVKKKTYS